MLKEFKKRSAYVLDNEQGDIPVGTIAIIGVAIAVGVGMFTFRKQLLELIKQAGKRIDEWKGEM